MLATVSNDSLLRVWSAASGKELARVPGQLAHRNGLALSPDGKTLASVGANHAVLLYELPDLPEQARDLVELAPKRAPLVKKVSLPIFLGFLPDGKTLLVGELDLTGKPDSGVCLWNVETGQEVRRFRVPVKEDPRLALSPDGKTLAVTGSKQPVTLWSTEGEKRGQIPGTEPVLALAFSPDSRLLAAGIDNTDAIRLWDVATRKEVRSLPGTKELPLSRGAGCIAESLAFTPDGKTLVSVGCLEDDRVRVWDVASGAEQRQFQGGRGDTGPLAISPDGRVATVAGYLNRIRMWDLAAGKELHTQHGLQGEVTGLAVFRDGKWTALGSFDGVVRLYETKTGREVRSFPAEKHSIADLAFSPDGKQLLATVAYHPARLWDLESGKEVRSFPGALGSVRGVWHGAFSPDGTLLALSVPEPAIQMVDPRTGKLVRRVTGVSVGGPLAFSPDSRTLVAIGSGADRGVFACAVASGKVQWRARTEDPVAGLAFSADGKQVVTGSYGALVNLWNADNGELLRSLSAPSGTVVRAVACSPDGRLVAAGCDSPEVLLLETATWTEVRRLKGHTGGVWHLAFTPDGRSLVTGSFDATGLVWDMTGRAFVKKPARPLTDAGLEQLWLALGQPKAEEGYQAVWSLVQSAEQALPFLDARLGPAPADAKTMARLLANLDSEDFTMREAASAALARLGQSAEADLKEVLVMKPAPRFASASWLCCKSSRTPGMPGCADCGCLPFWSTWRRLRLALC